MSKIGEYVSEKMRIGRMMLDLITITTDNMLDFVMIIVTLIGILAAKNSITKTIAEQKNENRLKNVDELPSLIFNFVKSISEMIFYYNVEGDSEKHKAARDKFNHTLPKLRDILLMYGSKESVKVFHEITVQLPLLGSEKESMEIADLYALLLLLYTTVRYDLNNERIDFEILFDLLIKEARYHKQSIKGAINKYKKILKLKNKTPIINNK